MGALGLVDLIVLINVLAVVPSELGVVCLGDDNVVIAAIDESWSLERFSTTNKSSS